MQGERDEPQGQPAKAAVQQVLDRSAPTHEAAWSTRDIGERPDSRSRLAVGVDMTSGAWTRFSGWAAGSLGKAKPTGLQDDEASARSLMPIDVLAWVATGTIAAVALATIFDGLRLARGQESNPDVERGGYFLLGLGAILIALCAYPVLVRKPLTPTRTEPSLEAEAGQEPTEAGPEPNEAGTDPNQPRMRRVAACLALIVAFIVLLPWVGFALANAILLVGYLSAVSRFRWITAIVAGCAIDAVFVALFVMSRVPMPTGVIFA